MVEKFRKVSLLLVFAVILFGWSIASLLLPDQETSSAERRKLEQLPEITAEGIFQGDYMADLESYLLDQFPLRDEFRAIKSHVRLDVLGQKDNNDIYFAKDHVLKMQYPLKEDQVLFAANKINQVQEKYLQGLSVYYSVVPDKNYFVAEDNGYLHMDYDKMMELMQRTVTGAQYISVFDLLALEDYYYTDAHWKQESVFPVAEQLASVMQPNMNIAPTDGYTTHTLSPFYGVYWGQSARPLDGDVLTYLTTPAIEASTMTGAEFEGEKPIYTVDLFQGMDGYDVFAAGAQAIITMESPLATTDKELIIFRDSYGSSLAPLLLEGYSKITLVDLRYVTTDILGQFVEFTNQDVLFLYSTSILNSGMLLK